MPRCRICSSPPTERAAIEEQIVAGNSWRSIGATYAMDHNIVGRHARGHLGLVDAPDPRRRRNARDRVRRHLAAVQPDLKPIEGPADVQRERFRVFAEAWQLYEIGRGTQDTRLMDKALGTISTVLESFAKTFGMNQPDVVVSIDQSTKIINHVINTTDESTLRGFLAGDPVAIAAITGALEATSA